ncbi:MAG: non-ribosomal peptide synthetase, partial [Marivirga sp.]|nr:non-ribosomal peptide synthetase [Marivirga sp.]
MNKGSLAYNLPQVLRLEGELDIDKLTQVFRQLIDRHESLRTSFLEIEGQVIQKLEDQVTFDIELIKPTKDKIETLLENFVRPFDLSIAPLIRVGLIMLSERESLLIVDLHHIITDGVSQGVLIKDFMALYNKEELPLLRLQYKDYSEWQQSTEQRECLANQRAFWMHEFSETVGALDLPTDFPRPLMKNYEGNNMSFSLTKEDTEKISAIGEEAGATLFMTILSVFNVLLSKLSNQEDITVGTGIAGRYHADLEGIVGMFVNTLVLRNHPKGDLSFREFVLEVKRKTLACFDNQSYQYDELIDGLNIPRNTSRNPLFDVMLAFQNFEQDELTIPGLKLKPYDLARSVAKFDLELTVIESDELHL